MSSATRGEIADATRPAPTNPGATISSADTGVLDRTQTSLATAPSWLPTPPEPGLSVRPPGSSRYEPPSDTANDRRTVGRGSRPLRPMPGAVLGRIAS